MLFFYRKINVWINKNVNQNQTEPKLDRTGANRNRNEPNRGNPDSNIDNNLDRKQIWGWEYHQ